MGARESNAGDDFHILWAARCAVRLLQPGTELLKVTLEGLTPTDDANASADLLLGVDLTEYFGGLDFASATRVAATQLKYSVKHADNAWTAARLARPATRSKVSVVQRLAEIFKAFSPHHPRTDLLKKLSIGLVSNQPVHAKLRAAVEQAQTFLATRSNKTRAATLFKHVDTVHKETLHRLYTASKLKSFAFTDFLRIFDLAHCGAQARHLQELELGAALAQYGLRSADKLYTRIAREALPEGAGSFGVTRADVLATFGISSESQILPSPSRISLPETTIQSPDPTHIKSALADSNFLLVHGGAGVGKSTTLASLENNLGKGSKVIVYDCFGNGDYLTPGEERHTARRALLQLVNELGIRCGFPMLLDPPTHAEDLWRRFNARLAEASHVHQGVGRIVIAIDAADNAMHASRIRGSASFVPDMWRVKLPSGAAVLMTVRSHRQSDVEPPAFARRVELLGFDQPASAAYLATQFAATEEQAKQFHEKTRGNPRLQFYMITSADTLDDVLESAHTSPSAVFEDIVEQAIVAVGHPTRSAETLATLLVMTRPLTIAALANATDQPASAVTQLCKGLAPGVVVENGVISLRDEDFETHLRERVGEALQDANDRLASRYLDQQHDRVACIAVAEHLYRAGRGKELVAITVNAGQPEAIEDPVERFETFQRRIALSLRLSDRDRSPVDSFRLLVLAAEAAHTEAAIQAIVADNPELAMRYGDAKTIDHLYTRREASTWNGPLHLRASAMFARTRQRQLAKEHLGLARAWLRRRGELPSEERHKWPLDVDDIAAGCEAVFWLAGPKDAMKWLMRWRPFAIVLKVAGRVADAVAASGELQQITEQLGGLDLPVRVQARFIAACWRAGKKAPASWLERIAGRPIAKHRRMRSTWPRPLPWRLDCAEHMARSHPEDALRVLRTLSIEMPLSPHPKLPVDEFGPVLRSRCLEAALLSQTLTPQDLLPADVTEVPESASHSTQMRRNEDKRRYLAAFEQLLPVHQWRAQTIVGGLDLDDVEDAIKAMIAKREREYNGRWHRYGTRYRYWARCLVWVLVRAEGDATTLIRSVVNLAQLAVGTGAPDAWLDVAEELSRAGAYREEALRLIDRAAEFANVHELPAKDRSAILIRAARLADRVASRTAADYYSRAITAAADLDDERVALLRVNGRLAESLSSELGDTQRRRAANRLATAVEAFTPHVSDPDFLPHDATLRAVTSLDPSSGLALLSRWDDENRIELSDHVAAVVRPMLEAGGISFEGAVSLFGLASADLSSIKNALSLLETSSSLNPRAILPALKIVAQRVRRDFRVDQRRKAVAFVVQWVREHAPTLEAQIPETIALHEFLERPAFQEPIGEVLPTSVASEGVAELAKGVLGLEQQLQELSLAPAKVVSEFLFSLVDELPVAERVGFLNALVNLPVRTSAFRWHAEAILDSIDVLVRRWRTNATTQKWMTDGLESLVLRHFEAIVGHGEGGLQALQRLAGNRTAELILLGTASTLGSLSADQLYRCAQHYALLLSASQRSEALEWSLDRLVEAEKPPPPSELGGALASFFYALFGHADVRVRWRTAHTVRALVRQGNSSLLASLVDHIGFRRAPRGFRDPELPFYSWAAEVWLLLVLARSAEDSPMALAEHVGTLANHALDEELPHVVAREFARRTALRLVEHGAATLPEEVLQQLRLANQPKSCHAVRGSAVGRPKKKSNAENLYRFDEMDTLPYWFEPLGRLFGLDRSQIAARAARWIVEEMGYTEDDVARDVRALRNAQDWALTSNRHGSMPILTNLATYLDLSSMFLTAGELIDNGAQVLVDEWDPPSDPWSSWMKHYVDSAEWWISDLRSPTPLVPKFHGIFPDGEKWVDESTFDYRAELLRTPSLIVVAAHHSVGSPEFSETVRVMSSLVNPDGARSLVAALQTAKNPHDFRLPYENEEDFEFGEAGFVLTGWLEQIERMSEGIEHHDPLRRITRDHRRPGEDFTKRTRGAWNSTGLSFLAPTGESLARTTVWADEAHEDSQSVLGPYSDGYVTEVRIGDLRHYLEKREMHLVMGVEIQRDIRQRRSREPVNFRPPRIRIYMLRSDGVLEWLGGSCTIG